MTWGVMDSVGWSDGTDRDPVADGVGPLLLREGGGSVDKVDGLISLSEEQEFLPWLEWRGPPKNNFGDKDILCGELVREARSLVQR